MGQKRSKLQMLGSVPKLVWTLVNICGSSIKDIKGSTPSPLFIRGEQSDSWDAMSSGRISGMKPSQNEFLLMATSDETKPRVDELRVTPERVIICH